jgi:hypothetical protein
MMRLKAILGRYPVLGVPNMYLARAVWTDKKTRTFEGHSEHSCLPLASAYARCLQRVPTQPWPPRWRRLLPACVRRVASRPLDGRTRRWTGVSFFLVARFSPDLAARRWPPLTAHFPRERYVSSNVKNEEHLEFGLQPQSPFYMLL